MRSLVIYHNKDIDGFYSAAIAVNYLQLSGHHVEIYGYDYSDKKLPKMGGYNIVYMVDVTLPFGVILDIIDKKLTDADLFIIDHHPTIRDQMMKARPEFCKTNYNYSGKHCAAELCLGIFALQESPITKIIGDWDTHRLVSLDNDKHQESAEFNLSAFSLWGDPKNRSSKLAMINAINMSDDDQKELINKMIIDGKKIAKYLFSMNSFIDPVTITLDGRKFDMYNMFATPYIKDSGKPKIFATMLPDKRWKYSLRGDSVVNHAKKRGGGGHNNACSFVSAITPDQL